MGEKYNLQHGATRIKFRADNITSIQPFLIMYIEKKVVKETKKSNFNRSKVSDTCPTSEGVNTSSIVLSFLFL